MIYFLLLNFVSQAFSATPIETELNKQSEVFFQFPRVLQLAQSIKASAVVSRTALLDRGLSLSANFSQTKSPNLSNTDLLRAGGAYNTKRNDFNSSLTFGLRNMGALNSTELKLNAGWTKRSWQTYDSTINPLESSRDLSLNLSYDVIKGGYNDPTYLGNKSISHSEFANLLRQTDQLVRSFLDYKYLILDLYSSHCKVRNAENDLEVISKVADEIKLAYQLKTVNYKQYLNIIDTKNFIERNKITYELGYQSSLQRLMFWSDTSVDQWNTNFAQTVKCPESNSDFMSLISEDFDSKPKYSETIVGIQTIASKEAASYNYKIAKQSIRPSVRPFVEIGNENSLGYENKKVSMGVSFFWDTPSQKSNGIVMGASYNAEASQIAIHANEQSFNAQINSLMVSFSKNKELLNLAVSSLQNSNSLVRLLEVQKSIGQIDSVSVSNAYTQRNQILNSIFDSIVNLEKNKQEVFYLNNWKDVLTKIGINLK